MILKHLWACSLLLNGHRSLLYCMLQSERTVRHCRSPESLRPQHRRELALFLCLLWGETWHWIPTPVISGSQLPRLPPGLLARKLGPIRQKSHNSVSVWGFVSGLNRGGITVVLSRSVRVSYSCSSSTTHQKAFVGNVNIKSSVLQNLKPQNKCATLGLIIRQYFLHDIQTGDLGWML